MNELMELRLLRTFVAVAELKNFSAAARELHTVQPAISRQIADLESELDVRLFWRSTREVKVTAAGEILLREATEILAHEARARALVQQAAKGHVGRLRIGYISTACLTFMPDLIRNYAQSYPQVQIVLHDMSPQQQLEAFAAGLLDIGISRPLPHSERKGYVVEQVYMDTLVAVLPTGHPLATAASIRLRDLETESFVLFKRSEAVSLFDQIISTCEREGIAPHISNQPESMQMLLTEVAAGLGVAVVPGCVRHLHTNGCVFVPISRQKPSIPTELHYRAEPAEPAIELFVAQTMQARQNIKKLMAAR